MNAILLEHKVHVPVTAVVLEEPFKTLGTPDVTLRFAPGAEEWFYHRQGQMLLNGSLTQADVPATRLSLDRIAELVKIGIDPSRLKPLCQSTGRCMGEVCDWYTWSLARCVKLRRPAPDSV